MSNYYYVLTRRSRKMDKAREIAYLLVKGLGVALLSVGGFSAMLLICMLDTEGELGTYVFIAFIIAVVVTAAGYGLIALVDGKGAFQ